MLDFPVPPRKEWNDMTLATGYPLSVVLRLGLADLQSLDVLTLTRIPRASFGRIPAIGENSHCQ